MNFTLLDIVQEILSAMDSDEVNSISDTVESNQVAMLVRSVYYDLAIDLGLSEHETVFELLASGDPTKPCQMTVPENVSLVREIRYNNISTANDETTANYQPVRFMPFDEFLEMMQGLRDNDNAGEQTFTLNEENFEVAYLNDKHPTWFTTPDDRLYLFDSYDAEEDTTLQKSKTMCNGVIFPAFELENDFVIDIDPTQFSLLKNRAKVRAFAELKQSQNQEAAGEARRQKIIVQKRKRSSPDLSPLEQLPRYGRTRGNVGIPKRLRQGM